MVIWITGLSGAGKSTLASAVSKTLVSRGVPTASLDGDAVRRAIADPAIGHDRESRLANARRISRLAAMLESQGLVVVVSTMSLFREIHALNRELFENYLEVLLQVDMGTLLRRDPHGLYKGAAEGAVRDVAGVDLGAEMPEAPHLRLDNRSQRSSLSGLALKVVRTALGDAGERGAAYSERPIRKTPAKTRNAPSQRAGVTASPSKKRAASSKRTK